MCQQFRFAVRAWSLGLSILLAARVAPAAIGADKAQMDVYSAIGPTGPCERLASGYRWVTRLVRVPIAADLRNALAKAGKKVELDPKTGEQMIQSIVDYLPEGWGAHRGGRVDSLGRPIVNEAAGLPGWAQADVDALRNAIAYWKIMREETAARGQESTETDGILGNFIGQAIVREIGWEDLVDLEDPSVIGEHVARSIIDYLHFYENLKFVHATDGHYRYQQSAYPAEIVAFVSGHGARMEDVLSIETPRDEFRPMGGQPSGCYARTAFARGMTLLSGQTDIWVANDADDVSADVPTGFPLFFFYDCQDAGNNDMVRVSSNGYISFFQRGGGATDGIEYSNQGIPDATPPDGYAAPWWDDLFVSPSQGNVDRVSYKTEGAVDSRVFTVEYFSISRIGGSLTDFHFFQVKLFETIDVVELQISTDWSADTADNATVGLENYDGAGCDCGPNCLNSNSQPPPNDYRFTPVPRPDNDNCGNAIELINGASVTGNLHRGTPDGAANCGSSLNNRDVWYTFVARCNGTLRADTCGSRDINGPDTGIDSVLSVHSGCPGTTANQLACNDDASPTVCNVLDSAVSVPMAAGQRVFIRVTHFGDAAIRFNSGQFRLNLNFVSSVPPANDSCTAAAPILDGNTLVGNLLCASNDGAANCGSSATNPDIWYQFTAPSRGRLAVRACGSRDNAGTDTGPDTVLSVHAGCPGTIGNQVGCNDDGFLAGCNTVDSRVLASVAAGQTVLVRVSHFGSNAFRVGNGVTVVHADFCRGADCNCDGHVDGLDIGAFVLALLDPVGYASMYPGCDLCHSDMDADDAVTTGDVGLLVQGLLGG